VSGTPGTGPEKVICDFRLTGKDESAGAVPGDALEGEGDLVIPARWSRLIAMVVPLVLLEDQLHIDPAPVRQPPGARCRIPCGVPKLDQST